MQTPHLARCIPDPWGHPDRRESNYLPDSCNKVGVAHAPVVIAGISTDESCSASVHPAAGGRGMTVTWNPYRGPVPELRPAELPPGIPGMPSTGAGLSCRAVLVQPPPGSAAPAWFSTWVSTVQVWGTDNRPTVEAWLLPAEIQALSVPGTPLGPSGGTPPGKAAAPGAKAPLMGVHPAFPEPEPMGGIAWVPGVPPSPTALTSAIEAVMAGSTMAGLI